ncbi:esterase/lipase family protein [Nocardia sp. CA-119907]|uniref:esterase/lipase family protein n=1 Tax=Nocardia sp. CA-119907 TaxID=3239973 RepID=UPI003D986EFD
MVAAMTAMMLSIGYLGNIAHAEPDSSPNDEQTAEQQLADYIGQGRPQAGAIAGTDSGSSSGLSGGFSSDTVGYGPQSSSAAAAFGYSLLHPDAAPPGTNDWNCKPTAEHPRPVVLVHGTWMNAYDGFAYMSQPITDAGFCTFTFNYGRSDVGQGGGLGSLLPGAMGTGYIQDSAKQLATFVDRVLAATGATQVDLIGHSQGGAMSNWYTKFEGGATKVHNLITYGATNHGTSLDGIGTLGRAINNLGVDVLGFVELFVGHAGIQQTVGSAFVNQLNAGGDTVPGIDYTIVATRYDEVTNPYASTFLTPGPGATVQNITLQDGCEQDVSDHITMMYSPRALSIALNALDPAKFPDLQCTFNPWLIGGGGSL